jgi:predicted DNA-binding transcriptional regulator AlpA
MVCRQLRYNDLHAKGVVKSRAQLKNLIEKYNFPPGRMLGPNTRTWDEPVIDEWMESCPTASTMPLRGGAKRRAEQARARDEAVRSPPSYDAVTPDDTS